MSTTTKNGDLAEQLRDRQAADEAAQQQAKDDALRLAWRAVVATVDDDAKVLAAIGTADLGAALDLLGLAPDWLESNAHELRQLRAHQANYGPQAQEARRRQFEAEHGPAQAKVETLRAQLRDAEAKAGAALASWQQYHQTARDLTRSRYEERLQVSLAQSGYVGDEVPSDILERLADNEPDPSHPGHTRAQVRQAAEHRAQREQAEAAAREQREADAAKDRAELSHRREADRSRPRWATQRSHGPLDHDPYAQGASR